MSGGWLHVVQARLNGSQHTLFLCLLRRPAPAHSACATEKQPAHQQMVRWEGPACTVGTAYPGAHCICLPLIELTFPPEAHAGSDELLAAEQLAALAGAALDLPAAADHSGGSTTAGPPPRQGPVEQPHVAPAGLQAGLAAPAEGGQHGAAAAAGAAYQAAAAHAAGGPDWAAVGGPLALSRIDLPTSIVLMQQAAGVIRGLHEELQRTKTQVRPLALVCHAPGLRRAACSADLLR